MGVLAVGRAVSVSCALYQSCNEDDWNMVERRRANDGERLLHRIKQAKRIVARSCRMRSDMNV